MLIGRVSLRIGLDCIAGVAVQRTAVIETTVNARSPSIADLPNSVTASVTRADTDALTHELAVEHVE